MIANRTGSGRSQTPVAIGDQRARNICKCPVKLRLKPTKSCKVALFAKLFSYPMIQPARKGADYGAAITKLSKTKCVPLLAFGVLKATSCR